MFKSPIHFHCVLHANKRGEGVQIACKIAYVLNGRPLIVIQLYMILTEVNSPLLEDAACQWHIWKVPVTSRNPELARVHGYYRIHVEINRPLNTSTKE